MRRVLQILVLTFLLAASASLAVVPGVINHQGRLTNDAGVPLSGGYEMTFRFYHEAAGGSALWSEVQMVVVDEGVFNVYLGDVTPLDEALFTGQDLYLGVTVAGDSEMTPRMRMGSVLFAFAADQTTTPPQTWYYDFDNDTFGDPLVFQTTFEQPQDHVANNADCDDSDPDIHPGAEEFCDGIDSDCNGDLDNDVIGPPCDLWAGVCGGATKPCDGELGWGDCRAQEYGPDYEQTEVTCDGLDNDCDGQTDEDAICPSDGLDCTMDVCGGMDGCQNIIETGMCVIAGVCYEDGELNPLNDCQECNAAMHQMLWSWVSNGTPCAGGTCQDGNCQ